MRKSLILLTTLLFVLSPNVFAIELGSVADSRFGEIGWTLDGTYMSNTRAKLLEPSNFGPGGTVPEAVNITDVAGEIDFIALSTFDVFFIGYLWFDVDEPFTEDELQAMQDWVAAGGTMIITCDLPEVGAVCEAFGPVPNGEGASPPAEPTQAGSTRPPFDGPFGEPASLDMYGDMSAFDDTGGFMVLAEDQDGDPVILEALLGDGRVVVLADVDMISDYTLSDGTGISNDNDRFLGNLIAYLANEAEETFVINPGVNGNWWGGQPRNGEGAQLELVISGEVYLLVLTFYSYDNEGNQIFLIAIGLPNGNEVPLTVYITEGGLWGDNFDPGLVNETAFGTGSVSFSHCGLAHLVVTPNAQNQAEGYTEIEYDLTRLAQPAGPCPISDF